MRKHSEKRIAMTCLLSIALCLTIPLAEGRPFAPGGEDRTGQPQKGNKPSEPSKYDRIEPKYEGGKYVGDKYYRGGKLVKETTTEYQENSDKAESETITEY